ncbi:MAG: RNA-binding transcriptional accessory protein [Lachnospiraceae bacterium]|nr:RNA-binding transcriptional accessory protein [Lachnospiraceae bacterium]
MIISQKIAEELGIRPEQAEAAISLIDEGNTIPFISRYRKEVTGSLNDEQLRSLDEKLRYLRGLEERKAAVLASIESQGKLTDELRAAIEAADKLVTVEDLYRPYKPKRRTRAMIAMEKGLRPLADTILGQSAAGKLAEIAASYIHTDEEDPAKSVATAEEAIAGAADIIAEDISDNASYRDAIRKVCGKTAVVYSELKVASGKAGSSSKSSTANADADEEAAIDALDEKRVFEAYYDYNEPISKIPGHRILAINRGEAEGVLNVTLEMPEDNIISALDRAIIGSVKDADCAAVLRDAIRDSYKRLIAPSIERELRTSMTERAEEGAMKMFGKNLEQLLMQPPIAGMTVLGWDPAYRTGCKLAVVDPTGKVLDTAVIYPTPPHNKTEEAKRVLKKMISKYGIDVISLGNGTASRESEQFICELIRELDHEGSAAGTHHLKYVIVNEAGASVYSASELATQEMPGFDVGQRSSASMARRLQDPLAELVKMDPKSIGVGQYQHDMDQKKLAESLGAVIEDCVNKVGVDLNTASAPLLSYVSGINKTIAGNIVSYREANGRFRNRRELLKVAKLGPKAYEQCAGFLRIRGGSEPLDQTAVHPESYAAAKLLLERLGYDVKALGTATGGFGDIRSRAGSIKKLATELGIGEPTLKDIISELEKPGRDPRDEMPKPVLKSDVLSMEDLKEGMRLKGTVRNIVDFGAFVDIGVHQDGLVHISRMSERFIKSPLEVVSVGDVVDVTVVSVDLKKQRIALSMV